MFSYKQNKYELKKAKILNKITTNSKSKNILENSEILDECFLGYASLILKKNNFDSSKYFINYNNRSEHVFISIKLINWSISLCETKISRCGDLICYNSINIELPMLHDDKIKEKKNYIKLYIYKNSEINFNTYIFSKYLKELYIEFENFNFDLKNLPESLIFLSICSKLFNSNLTMLPDGLEYLYINSNYFNMNLTNLPKKLKVLSIVTLILTVKFDNLPQGLKILHINSQQITNPDIFSYLPESIEYLYINCNDLTKLNLSDLPRCLKVLSINTIEPLDNNVLLNLPQSLFQEICYKLKNNKDFQLQ